MSWELIVWSTLPPFFFAVLGLFRNVCRHRIALRVVYLLLGEMARKGRSGSRIAIREFWERARKNVNSQKWLGEGAKGILSRGSKSLLWTIRNPFCTGATPFCTSAKLFSLRRLRRPCPPLLNTFGNLPFTGSLPELSDCKPTSSKHTPTLILPDKGTKPQGI